MTDMHRRDFLKVLGFTGTSAVAGSSMKSYYRLIPYLNPPQDIVPGEATWYATTCRECPAGCGLLAKNRDGRIIKAEGNPIHPIGKGALCPRGQASLQGLYNPDRHRGPLGKDESGTLKPITWKEGENRLVERLARLRKTGRGSVVFLTQLTNGSMANLVEDWLSLAGDHQHIQYEAFAYEPLRRANRLVFGEEAIPHYRIDQADCLISFGAGFLETWLSNVEYARLFADFHEPEPTGESPHLFVHIGPRTSLTAANADRYIPVRPGDEYLIALGMLRVIRDRNLLPSLPENHRGLLERATSDFTLEDIARKTGADPSQIEKTAREFARAKHPLSLAEGLAHSSPHALETAVASNLLCLLHEGSHDLIDFQSASALGDAASATRMKELSDRMDRGEVDLLLVHEANPVFTLPPSWEFAEKMRKAPLVVGFSSCMDETSAHADLILPCHTPLESWGDYFPRKGIANLMQPAMGNLFSTRHLGDILLSSARKIGGGEAFSSRDFREYLVASWRRRWEEEGGSGDADFERFWVQSLQKGGQWEIGETAEKSSIGFTAGATPSISFAMPPSSPKKSEGNFDLIVFPTIQFYDGRTANRPWMQEMPDPIAQTTWGGWAEIHPDTARNMGIEKGHLLLLTSPFGAVRIPALPIFTVDRNTIAVPLGQGHTRYGRFAADLPANPMALFSGEMDAISGGFPTVPLKITVTNTGEFFAVANTDGNFYQMGRELVQTLPLSEYRRKVETGAKPDIVKPLPSGYDPRKDFYPPHPPRFYRWCMVVDLDRCIGCGACTTACYAENNLAVVGRERVLQGREMSWLTVQRYFDREEPRAIHHLVMLCQHCTEAPCESVCPVFAPQHSIEGLNNQVYNRCIGTRDCSQNDPYKVRRFNFYTYTHPAPLDRQLNPDVTVRQKGVMEKCSFCVQRIIEAKSKARDQGRMVQDDDFTTACAQTCPTRALTFGSLLDPDSKVSKLIEDPRAYQILKELNTKPAAIYLKKIDREI